MNRNIYMTYPKGRRGLWGKLSKISIVTQLLVVTMIISSISLIAFSINESSIQFLALKPVNILEGKFLWTLILHIFVHGNIIHLLINMFVLFSFGYFCEQLVGRKRFFWLYIISGLFAGLLSVLLAGYFGFGIWRSVLGGPDVFMVGASGALFGIITLLAVLIPNKRVFLLAGPILLIILEVILSSIIPENIMGVFSFFINALLILMVLGLFMPGSKIYKFSLPINLPFWLAPIIAIVPLVIVSFFIELPIGNVAHFGGAMVGFIYGLILRSKYKKKVVLLQKMFR